MLNTRNKKKEVLLLCNKENAGLVGLVETKVKSGNIDRVVNKIFGSWQYLTT